MPTELVSPQKLYHHPPIKMTQPPIIYPLPHHPPIIMTYAILAAPQAWKSKSGDILNSVCSITCNAQLGFQEKHTVSLLESSRSQPKRNTFSNGKTRIEQIKRITTPITKQPINPIAQRCLSSSASQTMGQDTLGEL